MRNFLALLLVGFVILIIIAVVIGLKKENKEEIAKYYKITKPTLNRWVQYFPCTMTFDVWLTKRKLMVLDSSSIKYRWGNDASMVLNKTGLAEHGSASKKAVAKCVLDNLDKIGISEEAWRKCSIFPPVISQRIIDLLIGKPVPTVEERFAALFTNPQTA
jgi:formaldehyde-activating enzyme involved in methanogenesis